eukprot:365661-Chlamydomonas_euryale.AAC.9
MLTCARVCEARQGKTVGSCSTADQSSRQAAPTPPCLPHHDPLVWVALELARARACPSTCSGSTTVAADRGMSPSPACSTRILARQGRFHWLAAAAPQPVR